MIEGLSIPAAGIPSGPNDGPNLCVMVEEVRARLGELAPDEDWWTEAQVIRAINEGVKRFNREQRWSWLYSSVSGINVPANTQTLILQPGVAAHRHLNLSAVRTGLTYATLLKRVDPREGFQLRTAYDQPNALSNGYLQWYYLESAALAEDINGTPVGPMTWTIRLVPKPNVAYTLEYQYIRNSPMATECEDVPDIPGAYAEAAIAWATGSLWLAELNGGGKAQEQFNIYESVLNQAKMDEDGAIPDTPLIWGGAEPQYDSGLDADAWSRFHMPSNLGP